MKNTLKHNHNHTSKQISKHVFISLCKISSFNYYFFLFSMFLELTIKTLNSIEETFSLKANYRFYH
jgi:hypothetical protein